MLLRVGKNVGHRRFYLAVLISRDLRPSSRPAMSGIVDSGPEGGHGNADANDPIETLRPWLAETQFRVIMHASGLLDGVIFRLFSSKSLLQPRGETPRSLSVAAHCSYCWRPASARSA